MFNIDNANREIVAMQSGTPQLRGADQHLEFRYPQRRSTARVSLSVAHINVASSVVGGEGRAVRRCIAA